MKETKWDCRFYKDERTCTALTKMVCREKECKFYKGIGLNDVLNHDKREGERK